MAIYFRPDWIEIYVHLFIDPFYRFWIKSWFLLCTERNSKSSINKIFTDDLKWRFSKWIHVLQKLRLTIFIRSEINLHINPYSENSAHFERKFGIDRIVQFWRFQCVGTQKICEISWVIIKNVWNENSACQLTQNSNAVCNFYSKIDYAQNLRKGPFKANRKVIQGM